MAILLAFLNRLTPTAPQIGIAAANISGYRHIKL
jgi:hypothetical protein